MNDTIHPDGTSDVPWPTSDHRVRVPDTSMLPDRDKVAPAVVGLLNQTRQGAHETIDRLADRAAPAARQLGEGITAAGEALTAKTDQWRTARDAWVGSARTTVRDHPLACIAAAVALGALVARITR